MIYEIDRKEGYSVVRLAGEIDLQRSPDARRCILGSLNEGRSTLVDLSAVEYIDSSGVASLVEGYQLAREQALKFALIGVSTTAMSVLQLARLDQVFPIYPTAGEYFAVHGAVA